MAYVADPCRYSTVNSGQSRGMQGSIHSRSPRFVKPRIDSSATRYVQLAEPVYHVHPPRPSWPAAV